jgi:hypothetical protein
MGHDEIRAAVLRRLDLLDRAVMADPGLLLPLARTEINRLTDGWRLLLTVHQRDDEGRCGACPTGIRGRRWPCPVWKMAYEQLIGEGLPHRKRTRPLRHPMTRIPKTRRAIVPETAAERTVRLPPIRGHLPRHGHS